MVSLIILVQHNKKHTVEPSRYETIHQKTAMKIVNFTLLVLPLVGLVSARRRSGAYRAGQREIERLWDDNGYTCSNKQDFLDFWNKDGMKDQVYDYCMKRYEGEDDNQDDCEDGAEDWATEKKGECLSLKEDCAGRGETAGEDSAYIFCEKGMHKSRRGPISLNCEERARRQCKLSVGVIVVELIGKNDCDRVDNEDDLMSDDYREMDELCDKEVDKWLEDYE